MRKRQAPAMQAATSREVGIEPMMRMPTDVARADAVDAWRPAAGLAALCRAAPVRFDAGSAAHRAAVRRRARALRSGGDGRPRPAAAVAREERDPRSPPPKPTSC